MNWCGNCGNTINCLENEHTICAGCGLWFHHTCAFMYYEKLAVSDHNRDNWKCLNCTKEVGETESTSNSLTPICKGTITANLLEKFLERYTINFQTQRKIDQIKKLLNVVHAKVDHNTILLNSQQSLINQQQEIIEKLQTENMSLRKQLTDAIEHLSKLELKEDNMLCNSEDHHVNGNKNASLHNSPLQKAESVGKYRWKVGDKCMAKYWEDNAYYNAEVTGISKKTCVVRFLEYGNFEEVLQDDCIPISEEPIENMNLQSTEHPGFNNNRSNHFSGSIEFRRGGTRPYIKPEANSGGRKQRYSQPVYVPPASRRESK